LASSRKDRHYCLAHTLCLYYSNPQRLPKKDRHPLLLSEFVLQLSVTDISPKKYNQDKISIAGINRRASGLCHCKLQTTEQLFSCTATVILLLALTECIPTNELKQHIHHSLLNNLLGTQITHSPQKEHIHPNHCNNLLLRFLVNLSSLFPYPPT